jgi:hypothetical protein
MITRTHASRPDEHHAKYMRHCRIWLPLVRGHDVRTVPAAAESVLCVAADDVSLDQQAVHIPDLNPWPCSPPPPATLTILMGPNPYSSLFRTYFCCILFLLVIVSVLLTSKLDIVSRPSAHGSFLSPFSLPCCSLNWVAQQDWLGAAYLGIKPNNMSEESWERLCLHGGRVLTTQPPT